jgi:hypothetical protein
MTELEELKELAKLAKESKWELKRLVRLVASVAMEIAEAVPAWTEAEVAGTRYTVIAVATKFGTEKFVAVEQEQYGGKLGIFSNNTPGSRIYLYGDYNACVEVAYPEEFIFFAKHLKEIVQAFGVKMEVIVATLRAAIEELEGFAQGGEAMGEGR